MRSCSIRWNILPHLNLRDLVATHGHKESNLPVERSSIKGSVDFWRRTERLNFWGCHSYFFGVIVPWGSDGCEMFRWSLVFMVGWGLIQQWVPDGRNNVLEDGRLSFHTGSGVSWNIDGGLWVVWNPI